MKQRHEELTYAAYKACTSYKMQKVIHEIYYSPTADQEPVEITHAQLTNINQLRRNDVSSYLKLYILFNHDILQNSREKKELRKEGKNIIKKYSESIFNWQIFRQYFNAIITSLEKNNLNSLELGYASDSSVELEDLAEEKASPASTLSKIKSNLSMITKMISISDQLPLNNFNDNDDEDCGVEVFSLFRSKKIDKKESYEETKHVSYSSSVFFK